MLKKYINYLKNNPEGYWFKRKLFGWGWVPVKWQGWVVILAFIAFLLWSGLDLESVGDPTRGMLIWFFARLILAIAVLITICYKTGESPKWQWGVLDEDKEI